jgi:type IV pilus assembly protein PilX
MANPMHLKSLPMHSKFPRHSKQSGVVLFVALILLLILSLIGVTAARMETVEERMSRNDDNHQIGMEAAEAALRAAEGGILSGIYSDFSANANGLYTFDTTTGTSMVPAPTTWSTTPGAAMSYTGSGAPNLGAIALAQPPQLAIESLPPVAVPGDSISAVQYASPTPPVTVYRVTVSAVGADGTSTTTLQSIFR